MSFKFDGLSAILGKVPKTAWGKGVSKTSGGHGGWGDGKKTTLEAYGIQHRTNISNIFEPVIDFN